MLLSIYVGMIDSQATRRRIHVQTSEHGQCRLSHSRRTRLATVYPKCDAESHMLCTHTPDRMRSCPNTAQAPEVRKNVERSASFRHGDFIHARTSGPHQEKLVLLSGPVVPQTPLPSSCTKPRRDSLPTNKHSGRISHATPMRQPVCQISEIADQREVKMSQVARRRLMGCPAPGCP